MEFSKKLYIIIGVLVLIVLILFLVWFFTKEKLSPPEEEPETSLCPKQVNYQGDVYNTVEIGGKCWLAKNLKTFSYRDGTAISKLTASTEWTEDKQGAYSCYYNQESYCNDYGALYNWYAVNNEKGLCPEGWSVPNQKQWAELERAVCKDIGYLDCEERFPDESVSGWRGTDEGLYLLSAGLIGGKDKYGFGAILAGFRNAAGPYLYLEENGIWWTATETEDDAYGIVMSKENNGIRQVVTSKSSGLSVRCIKD